MDAPAPGAGMPVSEDMRGYYARRAPVYEEIYQKPERQSDLAAIHARLRQSFKGRRVLDVACGTGYFTADFAANAAEVVGVDANPAVLALARAKELPHCRFVEQDAHVLDQALGTFGAAFVGFWWSHLKREDWPTFAQSLSKRLDAGAAVILIDNLFRPGSSTAIAHTDTGGNTFQDRQLADGSCHRVLKNFPEYEELLGRFQIFARSTHWLRLDYYWWFEFVHR